MMELIGETAGQIYQYLENSKDKTATLSKMTKDLDLKGNFTEMGIGWLAREGKIGLEKKGAHTKVRLYE